MDPANLPTLLGIAWLLPLASFTLIVFFGPRMGKHGLYAAYTATGTILISCILSLVSLFGVWVPNYKVYDLSAEQTERPEPADDSGPDFDDGAQRSPGPIIRGQNPDEDAQDETTPAEGKRLHFDVSEGEGHGRVEALTGNWYTLGKFGSLRVTIGYYIDSLTVLMFCMVTFIATCIHFYAIGYMHDELHDVTDHEVTLSHGRHLERRGRYYRFFQYLSLFCFSMLGLVIAGNIAMVFVFWELVGICSYFLIGFYIERKSASTAANKAFIVNRIGDFGMIIGLMALFGSLGTFSFGDWADDAGVMQPGIFSQVRPKEQARPYKLQTPDGMVKAVAAPEIAKLPNGVKPTAEQIEAWRRDFSAEGYGRKAYWLLIVAGLGIFCGCVGKSAQFPLHVWLPDAMEGPTPVSALVHSATMVAAGVYLVGRFFPVFAPEVLLVIAITGCITLFIGATIAITATDIKRVLAYSTVSQLGYMMLSLGVGGWVAGMFHLITHAFFKSLLFMCSGSVIHATHTNDMTRMGGLLKKMPWTGGTMLAGCLAIIGAGVPFSVGLSGHYSKDAILAQALWFSVKNPLYSWLFYVAAGGAAITAFYMFRLWYLTFIGQPRDHHVYEHAHESPRIMYFPLVVLAGFAIFVGGSLPFGGAYKGLAVQGLLEQARPAGTVVASDGRILGRLHYPSEKDHHVHEEVAERAELMAFGTALAGFLLATVVYGWRIINPNEVRRQFRPIYQFLVHKWYFDELYQALFVEPVLFVSRRVAEFDKQVIDRFIDGCARWVRIIALLDDVIDRYLVDGLVNWSARWIFGAALTMRRLQTGNLRQYVVFIVVGTVALFVLMSFYNAYAGVPR